MPVVPCPACGTAVPVEPDRPAACPECGLLVSARPRVRAERAAAPRRGPRVAAAAGAALLLAGAAAGGWVYYKRAEAERLARQRAWEAEDLKFMEAERERALLRDEVVALPAALLTDPLPPEVAGRRRLELGAALVGEWRGPAVGGGEREVEYRADGTYRDAVTGPGARVWEGKWSVIGPTGYRVLHVVRTGGGPWAIKISFEGDELVHDDEPGRATVLRRAP